MSEYDDYNSKKKDEYEYEEERESIDYSADGTENEPHVDGESIEMEAEVISGEDYAEEISGEHFSEKEDFSEQESISEEGISEEEEFSEAEAFAEVWRQMKPYVKADVHAAQQRLFDRQAKDAWWWRDACLLYFQQFSGLPLPLGSPAPRHTLKQLMQYQLKMDIYTTADIEKLIN